MNTKRCPWCGKLIDPSQDRCGQMKRKTPRAYTFGRCSHCGHYYGQHVPSSARSKIGIAILLLSLLAYLIHPVITVVGLFFCLFFEMTGPFVEPLRKMNEHEKRIAEEKPREWEAELLEGAVRSKRLYFLHREFDACAPFVTVSPICFTSCRDKSNRVRGYFLYEHEENETYMKQEPLALYDSDMTLIAKIRFCTDAKRSSKDTWEKNGKNEI